MKSITITILFGLLVFSGKIFAGSFDYSVINGKWGAYKLDSENQLNFTYLEISESGGKYASSYGNGVNQYKFDSTKFSKDKGLLVIDIHQTDTAVYRLVVSAFRTDLGSSLLTGSLYMFRVKEGKDSLFNSIPQQMTDLNKSADIAKAIEYEISESSK